MKILLADGYNLIYAHPRLAEMVAGDADTAREGLIDMLAPLASPEYYQLVMVVFDASGSRQAETVIEERRGIKVAFTRRNQSADSFIEAVVRRLASEAQVEVATSDRTLANIATGFGARARSSPDLLRAAEEAVVETRREARKISGSRRSPLEDRIGEDIRELLDRMRYQ